MRKVLLVVGITLGVVALAVGARWRVTNSGWHFVLENRSGTTISDIELIDDRMFRQHLDRLEPDETVKLPQLGAGEARSVAWSDAEGRWIAPRSVYVDVFMDAKVVFQPAHRVNNDTARPAK